MKVVLVLSAIIFVTIYFYSKRSDLAKTSELAPPLESPKENTIVNNQQSNISIVEHRAESEERSAERSSEKKLDRYSSQFDWYGDEWIEQKEGLISDKVEPMLSKDQFFRQAQNILKGHGDFFNKYAGRSGSFRGVLSVLAGQRYAFLMKLKYVSNQTRYPYRAISMQWRDHWDPNGNPSPVIQLDGNWQPREGIDRPYSLKFPAAALGPLVQIQGIHNCMSVVLFFSSVSSMTGGFVDTIAGPLYCQTEVERFENVGFAVMELKSD